jgi:hypothetical protein
MASRPILCPAEHNPANNLRHIVSPHNATLAERSSCERKAVFRLAKLAGLVPTSIPKDSGCYFWDVHAEPRVVKKQVLAIIIST